MLVYVIAIGDTPVADIEIDGFAEYTGVTTPETETVKSVLQELIQSPPIQPPMSPEGGHIHTQPNIPNSPNSPNSPFEFAAAHIQQEVVQQQQRILNGSRDRNEDSAQEKKW